MYWLFWPFLQKMGDVLAVLAIFAKNAGCLSYFGHFCKKIGENVHITTWNCAHYDMRQKMSNVLAVLLTFEMYVAIFAWHGFKK